MEAINISYLLQVSVLRHVWKGQNDDEILSQLCLKNELSYRVSFFHEVKNQ